jgi:hypothetical protein
MILLDPEDVTDPLIFILVLVCADGTEDFNMSEEVPIFALDNVVGV